KPIDKQVEITNIRLLEKQGGKSSAIGVKAGHLKAAVVVCSDTVATGKKQDRSGHFAVQALEEQGITDISYGIVADDITAIQNQLQQCKGNGVDLVLFTGGTGLSDRDVTPEAVKPYITKEIPG